MRTGTDWNQAAANQETPKIAEDLQRLGRGREGFAYRRQREDGPTDT